MFNSSYSMSYIVPFLTINSIIIDVSFTNLIFYGTIFYSYNSFYLLFNLNYSIYYFSIIILTALFILILLFYIFIIKIAHNLILQLNIIPAIPIIPKVFIELGLVDYRIRYFIILNIILFSINSNCTFYVPILVDFLQLFSTFFFKGIVNIIEVFTGNNIFNSIIFNHYISIIIQMQFNIILLLVINPIEPNITNYI